MSLWGLPAAVAGGLVSALLPVVNAEGYAVLAAARDPAPTAVLVVVVGLAIGQTLGKLLLYDAGRRIRLPRCLAHRSRCGSPRQHARIERATQLLRRRRTAVPLLLSSATVGLPPLAVVSVAAGRCGQRRLDFVLLCLLGRLARFAVIALPVAAWS